MQVLRWLLVVTLAKFARISRPLQTDLGTACTEFPNVVNTSFYSEWIINQNKHMVQLRIKPRIQNCATLIEQVISTRKYTPCLKLVKLSSLSCLISTTRMTLMLTHVCTTPKRSEVLETTRREACLQGLHRDGRTSETCRASNSTSTQHASRISTM